MYNSSELKFVNDKIENFLKLSGLTLYDNRYIRRANSSLAMSEIDYVFHANGINVCISNKFACLPLFVDIVKFVDNLDAIQQVTGVTTRGILLLKTEIPGSSRGYIEASKKDIQIIVSHDKATLIDGFYKCLYLSNIYMRDNVGDIIMLNQV